jgi:hypothetical protein
MAAPEYVPQNATTREDKAYSSPPWRTDSWFPDRPGELDLATGQQPEGTSLGVQGPDQGYAIKLANRFRGTLHLEPGEHEDDALAGALGVALRRSSLFGRAPVVHDLTIALTAFGFLDVAALPLRRDIESESLLRIPRGRPQRARVGAAPHARAGCRATPQQLAVVAGCDLTPR